jgi:hypothetical protein
MKDLQGILIDDGGSAAVFGPFLGGHASLDGTRTTSIVGLTNIGLFGFLCTLPVNCRLI